MTTLPSPLDFFARLKWIDGQPLLKTIEQYRRNLFLESLYTFRDDGSPRYTMVVSARAKKNNKSSDLVFAALYKLLIPESMQGNDCFILANDEDQAGDDLGLAKKLVEVNADEIGGEVLVQSTEILRRDGRGSLKILPARNAIGQHGKTAIFVGFDEIHGYRNYDLLEALAPDPTRRDTLTWITSYDTIYATPGVPLHDYKAIGKAGTDPRMLFSWYSGDYCSDPAFADLEPELRANPSIASWPDGRGYLNQQRLRLPTHKFRRLHLNLPGSPNGAFLDQGVVLEAIVTGRKSLLPREEGGHVAFVDMSGGSSDDATLAIAHQEGTRCIVDLIVKQDGDAPFNPRHAVRKFAAIIKRYGCRSVVGDDYAGQTFKEDFNDEGIAYISSPLSKTEIYEAFEPALNAGEVELPDIAKNTEQLLCLVIRGARIDHQPGDHDDFANACCGAVAQLNLRNQDWSASRGILELVRRQMAEERVATAKDRATPIAKEYAAGSVEHQKGMKYAV